VGAVSDEEALSIVRLTRPRMQESARDGHQDRFRTIYRRAGRPCPRCGAPIRERGQGDDNRTTYWCEQCQH
jgi:endonuclease-8